MAAALMTLFESDADATREYASPRGRHRCGHASCKRLRVRAPRSGVLPRSWRTCRRRFRLQDAEASLAAAIGVSLVILVSFVLVLVSSLKSFDFGVAYYSCAHARAGRGGGVLVGWAIWPLGVIVVYCLFSLFMWCC
ncbi:MAG: hypothetical protein ACLT98_12685 [Eggerthellaceae bacterium]